ncbi:hypothetical protein CYY_001056 [Polysphondylium violaceum]|uniref:Uncharacterized protein n=1 Tax=Polysphondylium violaceum TaxID=133409 RepID=A0A8J4V515_9MYCE|nr:hypothetical protein CYY_001056 [Polysphondylium violaceum]
MNDPKEKSEEASSSKQQQVSDEKPPQPPSPQDRDKERDSGENKNKDPKFQEKRKVFIKSLPTKYQNYLYVLEEEIDNRDIDNEKKESLKVKLRMKTEMEALKEKASRSENFFISCCDIL